MTRLVATALLTLVATAAAGCGADQDPSVGGASAPASTSGTAPGSGAAAAELALAVEVTEGPVAGGAVRWRLTVINGTGADVTLSFTSSQQGEVVLTSADGVEAYRWSDGMVFAQALTQTELAARAEVTFELTGLLDVEPGTYALEAGVTSDPAPAPARLDVTVTG